MFERRRKGVDILGRWKCLSVFGYAFVMSNAKVIFRWLCALRNAVCWVRFIFSFTVGCFYVLKELRIGGCLVKLYFRSSCFLVDDIFSFCWWVCNGYLKGMFVFDDRRCFRFRVYCFLYTSNYRIKVFFWGNTTKTQRKETCQQMCFLLKKNVCRAFMQKLIAIVV